MAHNGKYKPKYPEKYRGDPDNIIYRSSWERRIMILLDSSENVIEWSYEGVVISYQCATDFRKHRYYIDFWVKIKKQNGEVVQELWEVKPKKETKFPSKRGRTKKQYITETAKWLKNQSKWLAAKKFAKKHNMKFCLVTEDAIFRKRNP